jgi:hypothetical protein
MLLRIEKERSGDGFMGRILYVKDVSPDKKIEAFQSIALGNDNPDVSGLL